MINRVTRRGLYDSYDSKNSSPVENDIEKADLITSEVRGKPGIHAPVLDIDYPIIVIPSSTPGHNHLYIEKEIRESEYMALLAVLGEVGVIEPGFANASQERRWSAVRLPWIKKEDTGLVIPDHLNNLLF